MASRILLLSIVLSALATGGCPASSERSNDAAMVDGGAADGGGVDVGPGNDASVQPDAGPTQTWAACTRTTECTLRSASCCAPCGRPMLSQFDAVNTSRADEHFAAVCPVPTPCPRCATGTNADLITSCQSTRCAAFDVSMLPLSACTTNADCVVRYANCCGCSGDALHVVSIRGDAHGALDALLCDAGACALDCAPGMDPGFVATCDASTHHCVAMPR